MPFMKNSDPETIICKGDVARLVEVAADAGEELVRKQLTASQIRNIFGEVRAIEMNWGADPQGSYNRTILLQPKLAYAASRDSGRRSDGVRSLAEILTACIAKVQGAPEQERHNYFKRFVDFFEAILAYHKAAGGRTN